MRKGLTRYRLWWLAARPFVFMYDVADRVLDFMDERRFRIEREWDE